MRALLFTPPFLLLFAVLNLVIGAVLDSRDLVLAAVVGLVASAAALLRRWRRHRRRARPGAVLLQQGPAWRGGLPYVGATLTVLAIAYGEAVVLYAATHPWVEPPPGPVRGEVEAHGPDFGKGVRWRPDVCRPATNPGVTAAALMQDEPFPVAWVIRRPDEGIAAIDVQRSASAPTIRYYPADCTRLHGDVQRFDVQRVDGAREAGDLAGYADAECVHGDDTLTIHVDFNACATPPSAPVPAPPSGGRASAR